MSRLIGAEILLEQILRRRRLRIGLCQSFRTALPLVQPAALAHQPRQPPQPAEDAALRQRQSRPADAVAAVVWALVLYPLDLPRKRLVPVRFTLALTVAVMPRLASAQHAAQRLDRPFIGAILRERVTPLGRYFPRFCAKNRAPPAGCRLPAAAPRSLSEALRLPAPSGQTACAYVGCRHIKRILHTFSYSETL